MLKLRWYLPLLVVLLTNCSSSPSMITRDLGSTQTPLTSSTPSVLPFQGSTPEASDTVTPVPTVTATRSPQPKKTLPRPTPTPTPFPTLSLIDREASKTQVFALLENQGDCRLPCWWGLVPGKTTLEEARNRIEPLSRCVRFTGDFQMTGLVEYFHLVPEQYSPTGLVNTRLYFDHQRLYQIKILELDWPAHEISRFLHDYGAPDEIWFQTLTDFPGDHPPFYLFLFYPEKGILAYFYSLDEDVWRNGDQLHGCLRSGPGLYLWVPEEKKTFEEVGRDFYLGLEYKETFALENISSYTPATFYQTFQNASGGDVCLEFTVKLE